MRLPHDRLRLLDSAAVRSLCGRQRLRREVDKLAQKLMGRSLRDGCHVSQRRLARLDVTLDICLGQLPNLDVAWGILKGPDPRSTCLDLLLFSLREPAQDVPLLERSEMLGD